MSELKDCPFCASKNVYPFIAGDDEDARENVQWISCPDCDAIGPSNTGDNPIGDGDVFNAWNTRTDGWTSVEDLPKLGQQVSLWSTTGKLFSGSLNESKVFFNTGSDTYLSIKYVTHWMEVEPPK